MPSWFSYSLGKRIVRENKRDFDYYVSKASEDECYDKRVVRARFMLMRRSISGRIPLPLLDGLMSEIF